ncbi:uncharacterized protein EV154DRAFT_578494 [Mucor mucedo]|uniref:uncharacterized protein n=1 Tax=Mucor mucedo TaxID=29922 RepID=UPI00221E9C04|nr:uncharacterized protein EV154DRAFT_578494 [Mucor mucedo]KAI7874003.1 hypothetical protein EV154DRAFT_578494 [Mucor mucedo]
MTKYCFKLAHHFFLKDVQLQLLTQLFRNYNSKALHRNLTSSLTAFRSFVGRDFKILVQLLPTLLQKANFFNPSLFDENQDSFTSMFECFDNLGLLASLVYMEKIDNFHYYKQILDITVSKIITAMDNLHHTTVLTRRRSAAAGTEAITKMNFSSLQNGGRDVAVRFAEEFMLRHISQGGLFVMDSSSSVWETCGVKVLESFDATINQSELALLDNNNSPKMLALGTTGVFRNGNSSKSSGLSLGKIVMKNGQDFLVQAYDFVCHDSFSQGPQSSIYESCVLDVAGNVITRRLPGDDFVIAGHEQNRVEFVLDIKNVKFHSVENSVFGSKYYSVCPVGLSALDIRQLYINEKSKQANYFTQFDKYPQNRVIHSNIPKKPSMLSKISVDYLLNRILTYGNRISKR